MGTAGQAWTAAARRVAVDAETAGRGGAELDLRYAEPHRRYHTGVHAAAVVRDAAMLAAALGRPEPERDVVTLAACAHDVVYDARPGADERASAAWARTMLGGAAEAVVERVCGLVLATVDHVAGEEVATQILLDADLAILGADPAVYDGYAAAVRTEYAAVTDDGWRAGRSRVLRGLLDRAPLYRTAPARERWEDAARANLRRELGSLG